MIAGGARHEDLRDRVIAAAVELLAGGGLDALTTRALAKRAGTTTMTIYSRFGGMDGVLTAVLSRGFALLEEQLDAVPDTADARADVVAATLVYRAFAHESEAMYTVMFESDLRDAIAQAGESPGDAFRQLRRRVERTLGGADDARVDTAAFSIWALCHGLVTLERSGIGATMRSTDARDVYVAAIHAHLVGFGAA